MNLTTPQKLSIRERPGHEVYLTLQNHLPSLLDGLVQSLAGPFTGLDQPLFTGAVKEKVYSKAPKANLNYGKRIAEAAEFVNNGRFA
ncbi:hypothetical protein EVAR_9877_1 [Eumeta japonica]|uniref:Uncharacterized protein n=1 Tax=Eumeta variegata TaxID=151549 RepID=A0A4C1TQC9_EUMVA|nr:hypothetical protein EVAR_9877_1 [Eumeta japonica]